MNKNNITGTNAKKVRLSKHTEADRVVWFTVCLQYAAENLNVPISVLAGDLLNTGLAKWLINGYDVFQTQGYEYMAEKIINTLNEVNSHA